MLRKPNVDIKFSAHDGKTWIAKIG